MKSLELLVVVLIGFVGLVAVCQATDYCSKKICGGKKHIACNNTGNFASTCPSNRKLVTMTADLKSAILKKHNNLRNLLASGKMANFDQCPRMATMVWDDELAKLAELNVKTCKYGHDACHNTDKFPMAGQNIAKFMSSAPFTNPAKDNCNALIDLWWSEHMYTTKSDIQSYPEKPKAVIGHFTCMAIESNWALGCAVVTHNNKGEYVFALTCNYARINIIGRAIYSSGKSASKCGTGANPEFPGLCSTKEKY